MRIIGQAFYKDDFENRLTELFVGLCGEYMKWKTAEALGGDISSWKTESENLMQVWLKYFILSEVKGSIKRDLGKKMKILDRLIQNWSELKEVFYRFSLKELKKKGFPELRREQMPDNLFETQIEWLKYELRDAVGDFSKYPTLSSILGVSPKASL